MITVFEVVSVLEAALSAVDTVEAAVESAEETADEVAAEVEVADVAAEELFAVDVVPLVAVLVEFPEQPVRETVANASEINAADKDFVIFIVKYPFSFVCPYCKFIFLSDLTDNCLKVVCRFCVQ